MTSADLYALANAHGHVVVRLDLAKTPSMSLEGKRCYIALSRQLSENIEKEYLAHELGHCEYGGFYNRYSKYDIRAKAERRADKWAFSKLIPYGQLMEAVHQGFTEVWELAGYFDVSCEFMSRAIEYYKTAIA